MHWKIEWKNFQHEPTYKAYTLVLIHPKGMMYRIEKTFPNVELSVKYLEEIAKKEIKIIEAELSAEQ